MSLTAVDKTIPGKCLIWAGLGHVTRLSHDEWQATVGEDPLSKTNGSVWAIGPYATAGHASAATAAARRREIAFDGGKFVVFAKARSYLSDTVSLAAACLTANTTPGHFGF
jgi:hypothetical protein